MRNLIEINRDLINSCKTDGREAVATAKTDMYKQAVSFIKTYGNDAERLCKEQLNGVTKKVSVLKQRRDSIEKELRETFGGKAYLQGQLSEVKAKLNYLNRQSRLLEYILEIRETL